MLRLNSNFWYFKIHILTSSFLLWKPGNVYESKILVAYRYMNTLPTSFPFLFKALLFFPPGLVYSDSNLFFLPELSHENGNFMTACHSPWSCSVWLVADPLGTLKLCSRDFWNYKSGSHLLDSPWLWLNHHSVAWQEKCCFIFEPSGSKDFNRHEWKFSLKGNTWVAPHSWSFKIVPWVANHNHYTVQSSKKIRRTKMKWS